jgi:CO/xanthine dehydrogenase FAD-binding subunit
VALEAAEAAVKPAHPLRDNAFKVDRARNILRSALLKLA